MESSISKSSDPERLQVSAFYRLLQISDLEESEKWIKSRAQEEQISGMVVLSKEGINSTVSGLEQNVQTFVRDMGERFGGKPLDQRLSWSFKRPFRKFAVKVKPEIVTSRFDTKDELRSGEGKNYSLTPEEWQAALNSGEEVTILDTRNDYEFSLGHFRKAVDPKIEQFSEFKEYLDKSDLPKDRKTLIYCTGGIRCEKALFEMKEAGFKEVYQLKGGILNYLEQYPDSEFLGECFVFDYRVAVGQKLEPTEKYKLCDKCGCPAQIVDDQVPLCEGCR